MSRRSNAKKNGKTNPPMTSRPDAKKNGKTNPPRWREQ
jgi:hypothetical protein